MNIIAKVEAKIPSHMLPLIVNGDNSGLSNEDMDEFISFTEGLEKAASKINCIYDIVTVSDEEYFTNHPEFGLPCNVTDCVILFMKPE